MIYRSEGGPWHFLTALRENAARPTPSPGDLCSKQASVALCRKTAAETRRLAAERPRLARHQRRPPCRLPPAPHRMATGAACRGPQDDGETIAGYAESSEGTGEGWDLASETNSSTAFRSPCRASRARMDIDKGRTQEGRWRRRDDRVRRGEVLTSA